eukprot:Seg4562.2 transcript_id=Seg4562.2/GoldUCD/mRNA.D3Y31 product="hypothetical protein" protein_id=Seg4562.2/GoldUCD/D3Y31
MVVVFEFKRSDMFPNQAELLSCKQRTGSHTEVVLQKFKAWLKSSASADVAFNHRATAFHYFGPLLSLYNGAIKHGDGFAREIIYQLQLPVYAQLNFPNYFKECFRHTVNFLAKWPLATRVLMQQNCAVNLSGKIGCGIELDGYVEAELVKPLKNYATGHSTVLMCGRIMANLDLFHAIRQAYKSKECFDVHSSTRHSVQTSFPDQLKGAWFCLKKGFFKPNDQRKAINCYPINGKGQESGVLPSNFMNAYEKGKQKIEEKFTEKLYDAFPDARYSILNRPL